MKTKQTTPSASGTRRVVGLDAHPDSFAAAVLEGADADSARLLRSATRQQLESLEGWIQQYTRPGEIVVLEASANSFSIAERLRAIERVPIILESHRAAKSAKLIESPTSFAWPRTPWDVPPGRWASIAAA